MILRGIFVLGLIVAAAATLKSKEDRSAFAFQKVDYFHRWSQGTQHEFTPAKQEDLDHWADMITVHAYPGVDDGDKLAESANAVLGNYKRAQGKILKTNSVPATEEQPAEHFIAVLFTQPKFSEAAFARFKLVDGKGHSFVYSHRFYGDNAAEEMGDWLKDNSDETEKALMDWNPSLGQWKGKD